MFNLILLCDIAGCIRQQQNMKITFTNRKDRKNCQIFCKALKEIDKSKLKQSNKSIYISVDKKSFKMADSIQDIHSKGIQKCCWIFLSPQSYVADFYKQKQMIYKIQTLKLLRTLKKPQSKIVNLCLQFDESKLTVNFETDGKQLQCALKLNVQIIEKQWPQDIQQNRNNSYELISVGRVTDNKIHNLAIKSQQQMWIEIDNQGLILKQMKEGNIRRQNKISLQQQQNQFKYLQLKSKLKNKVFINLKSQDLQEALLEGGKKRRFTQILIKNIFDIQTQNTIILSYLIFKAITDFGIINRVIRCFLCLNNSEGSSQIIRQNIRCQKNRQVGIYRQSTLLKAEQGGIQNERRILLNQMMQIGADKKNYEAIYRQRGPVNKLQPQQTITRKFYSHLV